MPGTNRNCAANTPIKHEFWISDYNTEAADAYSMRFIANQFGVVGNRNTVQDEGTGSPWEVKDSEQDTNETVNGPISLTARPDQMAKLLPCMLGNPVIPTNVYQPVGSICNFFQLAHYDPVTTYVWRYKDAVVDTWQLGASDSQPLLKLDLNVECASSSKEVYNVSNFPGYPFPLSTAKPWLFRQATVTIGGTAYRVKSVAIAGNNNLAKTDFFNSYSRSEMPSTFQNFTFSHASPFDKVTDVALLNTAANVVGQVVFTSGTNVLTIDFPSLFARPQEPGVGGRERIMNQITWKCQYDPAVSGQVPIKFTLAS